MNDSFELYDLRVEVICPPGKRILCGAKNGDHFTLEGEMLYLPPGQGISIYSLGMDRPHKKMRLDQFCIMTGSVLPLLAAKQRVTSPNDWMTTDGEIACPDPNCPSRLRIVRIGVRRFSHRDVTVVPLERK